jgi:hypothetical protein
MSNAYEHFLCHECNRYLISGWGNPNCDFRSERKKFLCARCDPKGCAECGIYNCDCKCTACDGVIVELKSGDYQCKRCKKHYKNEYWLEALQ